MRQNIVYIGLLENSLVLVKNRCFKTLATKIDSTLTCNSTAYEQFNAVLTHISTSSVIKTFVVLIHTNPENHFRSSPSKLFVAEDAPTEKGFLQLKN